MALWVDDQGRLREGDEDQARRYGFRAATDEDIQRHNHGLDLSEADTKGTLGLIGEGLQRGMGHLQDAMRQSGWQPPIPGSEAFGPGGLTPGGLGETPAPPVELPPGKETFPEAFSPEARLRSEAHPITTGIGTGLVAAPFSAVAGAAGAALAPAAVPLVGGTVGGLLGESAVEAVAQEWDDAWLEQRPFELKRAAAYTGMFALGDVLLRGTGRGVSAAYQGAKGAAKSAVDLLEGLPRGRNIVAEAQARAEKAAGRKATQSVGAASAKDLAEPFDEALANMTERDATTLARDAEDHYQIISRHAADDITRIHRGLAESLGTNLKHEDFRIGADAWDNDLLERQTDWLGEMKDQATGIVDQLRNPPPGMNYGNAGAQIANDLEGYWTQIMNEADGAQRNILVDQLKKKGDKRMMALDADFKGDAVARGAIKDIVRDYFGVNGALRKGLENPAFWGHNAELQKALNAPWHRMLKGWKAFNDKFLEATGETLFDNMGADRKVMQATAEKVLGVLQKDPRLLHEFGRQVGEVFDGYQDLIAAREAHGITHKEGLDALRGAVSNLMEDWNLAATVGVAKNKAAHALRNPRNWGRMALDAAEKTPLVGGYVQAARNVGRNLGDLHIQGGTPLADVWDRGLRRYAQHPSLPDPSVYQNYSPWMQEALRARGAAIPGGTPGAAAADVGSKVAGLGLFGLGAAGEAQRRREPQDPNAPAQADTGLMAMGLGLAMLFKRRGSIRLIGERARRALAPFEPETVHLIDQAIEKRVRALGDDLMRGTRDEVAALMTRVKQEVVEDVNEAWAARGGGRMAPKVTDLRVEQTFAEAAKSLPEEVRAAANYRRGRRGVGEILANERAGKGVYESHPLEELFGEAQHERTVTEMAEMKQKRKLTREELNAVSNTLYTFRPEYFVNDALNSEADDVGENMMVAFRKAADIQEQRVKTALNGQNPSPDVRRYMELRMEDEIQQAWTREKRVPPPQMGGKGVRVQHAMSLLREAYDGDLSTFIREDTEAARREIQHSLRSNDFHKSAARVMADDIVDDVKGGMSFRDAVDGVADAVNEGAETIKLDRGQHRESAQAFRNWTPRASADLGFSVQRAIDEYAGDFDYRNINAFAREGRAAKLAPPSNGYTNSPDVLMARHQKQAEDLQLALDYAVDHGYVAPGKTWRGVLLKANELNKLKEVAAQGGVAEAHAFMSTTADEDYALRFIERKNQLKRAPNLRKVIIEVQQKTGVPVNPSEDEVLMRAGTRFQLEEIPTTGREHARFRATELDTDPRLPSELKRGAGGAKALPWIAGGVFALGNLTRADKAAAAGPAPELPEAPELPPEPAGPRAVYRDAVRNITSGGNALVRQAASAALRRTPPGGPSPLRSFAGRRDLDAAVDAARQALGDLQGDPSALVETLAGSVGELGQTHPSVYMALVEKATAIVSSLSAEAPARTGQTLLDPKGAPPSRDRSLEFAYKVVGAAMPTRAMRDIARLDAPPEEVGAFKQHWPELWEGLRLELLGQTMRRAEAGRPPDGEKLRALDGLLEMNGALDPSASLEVAQQILTAAQAAPAAPASQTSPDQAPSGQSKSFMTRQQASRMEAAING